MIFVRLKKILCIGTLYFSDKRLPVELGRRGCYNGCMNQKHEKGEMECLRQ